MPKSSDLDRSEERLRLIGLGESSTRKSYYPALQRNHAELLRVEQELRMQLEENRLSRQALQQALADAQSANRAKSEFLANMSHELRTPLNGILGTLQLLEATAISREQTDYLGICLKSGWALHDLLNDILDLSSIEAGQLEIVREPVDLRDLVDTAVQSFVQQLQQKGLILRIEAAADLPTTVIGDRKRLLQILFNLIGNAVKFSSRGAIVVRLQISSIDAQEMHLHIEVEDNGIGIEADLLDSIFEPFVQGESSYRKRFQGAGLGLAIVKRLVDAMQGTIAVASRVEVGTRFSIEIPVGRGRERITAADIPPEVQEQAPPTVWRILVVEDNDSNRLLLKLLLERRSHAVVAVSNGLEALHALAAADYDLVLMDIQMPVMDGLEALQKIRAGEYGVRNPRIPVIALTAYAMPGDEQKFLSAGMDGYLKKPIVTSKLNAILDQLGSAHQSSNSPSI